MSCNGCRVLRKGCGETCILRPCLQWIENPDAQGRATLFLAKFFGRSDLMSFISAVPDHQKPALFQSLLFEACGRTVNPVSGAVGLIWTGNLRECQIAVDVVLSGGNLRPVPECREGNLIVNSDDYLDTFCRSTWKIRNGEKAPAVTDLRFSGAPRFSPKIPAKRGGRAVVKEPATSLDSDGSSFHTIFGRGDDDEVKLLRLFV